MVAWQNAVKLETVRFKCGFCGAEVASGLGFPNASDPHCLIMICPNCDSPTFFLGGTQLPSPLPGGRVDNISADIELLYNDARKSSRAGAYTAAVLTCRKLLMNIAVQKGAAPGKAFLEYVDFLADKGYIPPDGKHWVDHIRKRGSEAAHEIVLMSRGDAEDLICFTEMLLRFIYEFPGKIRRKEAE